MTTQTIITTHPVAVVRGLREKANRRTRQPAIHRYAVAQSDLAAWIDDNLISADLADHYGEEIVSVAKLTGDLTPQSEPLELTLTDDEATEFRIRFPALIESDETHEVAPELTTAEYLNNYMAELLAKAA